MKKGREMSPAEHGANVLIGVGVIIFMVFLIIRVVCQIFGISPVNLAPMDVAKFAVALVFIGFLIRPVTYSRPDGDGTEEHY